MRALASAPVELRGIGHAYGAGELARPVLRDVDLSVGPGEIVLLTGPSGSGKTTLLTLIGALRAVQAGSAVVLGQQLAGAPERQRVALRRRIGFIFQQYILRPALTAAENAAVPLIAAGRPHGEAVERARELAKKYGWKVGDRVCSNFATDHIFGDVTAESKATGLGAPIDGVLTEYKVLPAHALVRIPEHLSYEEASTLP